MNNAARMLPRIRPFGKIGKFLDGLSDGDIEGGAGFCTNLAFAREIFSRILSAVALDGIGYN